MGLLAGEPHIRLRYSCSPQHTDSALYPIIGQMERAAGLARDDSSPAKLDKLDRVLKQTSTSAQDAALFAEMLSLPNDGRYPAVELTPQQRRQRTLEALVSQIEALARSTPVLMVFEDAHWSDPTSLEALGRAVDRIRRLSVLLIVTFRPEFEPGWIGQPHVTLLSLNRLAPREVGSIIEHIVGNNPLPANIRQDIIERTDGIPLFVEEMTKAVLEAESESEARRAAALVPSPALAVPATLHASLMARLDRLGPAKELAQIGRRSAASSPILCWLRSCASRRRGCKRRLTVLFRLVCCSGRVARRTRPTLSSMCWYGMRLTARCCASRDVRFMPELPKPSKVSSRKSRRISPSCWRVTAPRRGRSRKPRRCGGKRDSGRRSARQWLKLQSNSSARST